MTRTETLEVDTEDKDTILAGLEQFRILTLVTCVRNRSKYVHIFVDNREQYMYIMNKERDDMNFYTVRDLRTTPKNLWNDLSADGEVIITNNGKPTAILCDIADGNFEETVRAIRQAKAMIAFNSMREKAAASGYMSDEDIEAEIQAVRRGE